MVGDEEGVEREHPVIILLVLRGHLHLEAVRAAVRRLRAREVGRQRAAALWRTTVCTPGPPSPSSHRRKRGGGGGEGGGGEGTSAS